MDFLAIFISNILARNPRYPMFFKILARKEKFQVLAYQHYTRIGMQWNQNVSHKKLGTSGKKKNFNKCLLMFHYNVEIWNIWTSNIRPIKSSIWKSLITENRFSFQVKLRENCRGSDFRAQRKANYLATKFLSTMFKLGVFSLKHNTRSTSRLVVSIDVPKNSNQRKTLVQGHALKT